jgi:hypothetical protein
LAYLVVSPHFSNLPGLTTAPLPMASEAAVVGDVLSLLKRLADAVASGAHSEAVDHLRALEALPVTLPVLTKTKCGVAVAKLRGSSHADTASAAGALVKRWKRVAEDAGVAAAPGVAALARSVSTSSSASGASPLPSPTTTAAAAGDVTAAAPSTSASAAAATAAPAAADTTAASPSAGLDTPSAPDAAAAAAAAGTYKLTGAAAVPLPPARDRSRKILMGIVTKVVTEHVLAAAGAAAAASSSSSSSAAAASADGGAPLPPPPAREAALAQAEDVGASIEAALHAAFAYPTPSDPGKPGNEYAERFRTLAMGLPRNPPLVLNVYTGALPPGDLVRLSSDELVSDAARRKAEAIREQQ